MKVGIVGAGSAGLFAASELGKSGIPDLEIKVFDQGPTVDKRYCAISEGLACMGCDPCKIMSGIGGAGTYSSGILNLDENIGGELAGLCKNAGLEAKKIIEQIDDFFLKNGAPKKLFDPFQNEEKLKDLLFRSVSVDIRFLPIKQRLLGTENTPTVIKSIQKSLESEFDVKFFPNTKICRFNANKQFYFKDKSPEKFDAILLAPGRWGMVWLSKQCEALGIRTSYLPLDIGVRVEVPSIILEEICESIQRDPKFHIVTPTYNDFVRTFCVNHKGYVVKEMYEEKIVGVNGHQFTSDGDSKNSNFAFLIRQALTAPFEDTTEYGRAISKQASVLGGYKPIIQTLGDLRKGRRSRTSLIDKNPVQPTLKDVTPGDIAMAYPYRFVKDILEGLERLDNIIPGVNNDSTLIYAPEFKRSAKLVEVSPFLESMRFKKIFFAGDGAGLSRGIVGAAVTGIIAAHGIVRRIKK